MRVCALESKCTLVFVCIRKSRLSTLLESTYITPIKVTAFFNNIKACLIRTYIHSVLNLFRAHMKSNQTHQ